MRITGHFAQDFAHQGEQVSFRVFKIGQPEIVIRPGRHQTRFSNEYYAPLVKCLVNFLNVIDFVIDDRSGVIQVGPLSGAQHDADAAAIKECHVRRRLKEKLHAQRIAIKSDRAVEIFDVNEYLTNARQRGRDRDRRAHDSILLSKTLVRSAAAAKRF